MISPSRVYSPPPPTIPPPPPPTTTDEAAATKIKSIYRGRKGREAAEKFPPLKQDAAKILDTVKRVQAIQAKAALVPTTHSEQSLFFNNPLVYEFKQGAPPPKVNEDRKVKNRSKTVPPSADPTSGRP